MDYKQSGVDIEAGHEAVRRIRQLARRTFTPGVLSDIGSFGGLFRLEPGRFRDPVLVTSADGVGTKLRVAFQAGRHDTVGVDLVNHCVNDVLAQGAEPLFFLDYLATAALSPEIVTAIVEGMACACRENGCALLGGETAEMPGFYADGEYDLAGFIVGVVERDRIVDGRRIAPGDHLVGLPSSGLHTNGYTLARQIVFGAMGLSVDDWVPELEAPIGDVLLRPHRSYLQAIRPLLEGDTVKGLAHITGGGILDNLPRILPAGVTAVVDTAAWTVPPVFTLLQARGQVPAADMYRTFNMGIGMIVACEERAVAQVCDQFSAATGGLEASDIGRITARQPGDHAVRLQR